jgi:hypothetical protein
MTTQTCVLVFYDDGLVEVAILDDTGRHQADGTWSLDETDGKLAVKLEGALLGLQGGYELVVSEHDATLTLRELRSSAEVTYERVQGYRRPRPAPPN